jgi:PAS domain S-box-containing protein
MAKQRFPKDLIDTIVAGQAIAVVGSGLSVAAGLPSWKKLLEMMVAECEEHFPEFSDAKELRKMLAQDHYLDVAGECSKRLGKALYRDFMQRTFRAGGHRPTRQHWPLLQLPFSAILTTNYDNLIEQAFLQLNRRSAPPPVYTQKSLAELARVAGEKQFFILKLHGHMDDIDTVVLTQADYQEIIYKNVAYRTALSALMLTKTLVFIGYSLRDPDLNFILDEQVSIYQHFNRRHFAFVADPGTILSRSFAERFNIEIIPYSSKLRHRELAGLLAGLNAEVRQAQASAKRTQAKMSGHGRLPLPSEKLLSFMDGLGEAFFHIKPDAKWGLLTQAWHQITGFSINESLDLPVAEFVHPEDQQRHMTAINDVLTGRGESLHDDVRYRIKSGDYRWVEVFGAGFVEQGTTIIAGAIRDITERKQAQEDIQKLVAFVRFNPDPVIEVNKKGEPIYLNQAAAEKARALGLSDPRLLLPPNMSVLATECLGSPNVKQVTETVIQNKTIAWSFFPIIPSQSVYCYGSDITERLNLEAQLRHAQKLETVGQLAAGFAHDFNNILTVIQGHAGILLGQKDRDDKDFQSANQIALAADRAGTLTRQLLMFSRRQTIQTKPVDVNHTATNLTSMLKRLLGENIQVIVKTLPPHAYVRADPGMLEQILLNLGANSRDAMPDGGQLFIVIEKAVISQTYVQEHSEARAGEFVRLRVTDTGTGMSPETLARLFEPFFTTKAAGKGTGLGLATVYGMVKQHGGWISVESTIDVGTTFEIHLPSIPHEEAAREERLKLPADPRGNQERILVVDDELLIRELICAVLSDWNYKAEGCEDAHKALSIWEEQKGAFDLVLSDVVMPGQMTGKDLARKLREFRSDLKVILMTGYGASLMEQDKWFDKNTDFLLKPFPPTELVKKVRNLLDSESKDIAVQTLGTVDGLRTTGARQQGNHTILIVDDDRQVRELLAVYFRRAGFQPYTASNRNETFALIAKERVDVVVLDISLVGENGLDILGELKTRYVEVPVVMLTGMGFVPDLMDEARQKGADDYVSKVLPLDNLLLAIRNILARSVKERPTAANFSTQRGEDVINRAVTPDSVSPAEAVPPSESDRDGRRAMHKIFVSGNLVSDSDFSDCWGAELPPSCQGLIRETFLQRLAFSGAVSADTLKTLPAHVYSA